MADKNYLTSTNLTDKSIYTSIDQEDGPGPCKCKNIQIKKLNI